MLSDRAKYTYSNIQKACGLEFGLSTMPIVLMPCLVISTISPGRTSRSYRAPIDRKPQDSDEITQPSSIWSSLTSPAISIRP